MICTYPFRSEMLKGNIGFVEVERYAQQIKKPDSEPSMLVGNPEVTQPYFEDDGRTIHVPAPFKFYAIRIDEEPDKDAGETVGKSYVTFMLPEDY